jgi:hypothetical protein
LLHDGFLCLLHDGFICFGRASWLTGDLARTRLADGILANHAVWDVTELWVPLALSAVIISEETTRIDGGLRVWNGNLEMNMH